MNGGMAWRLLGLLLLALLAGAGTLWFRANFERVSEEEHVGYRGEARRNPLLAAQRFVESLGYAAETVDSLERLPSQAGPRDLVILPTKRLTLNRARADDLLDWMAHGGHLVLTTRGKDPESIDPLLDALEIEVHQVVPDGELTASGRPPGWPTVLEAKLEPRHRLEDLAGDAAWALTDDKGNTYGLQWAVGAGRFSVFADLGFLRNDRIGAADHAALLWQLIEAGMPPEKVWLVLSDDMPPLPLWLAQKAPALLVGAVLLLTLWLWRAAPRFGPRLPAPAPARRSLREHLRASGRFLWRHGSPAVLLEASRRALRDEIGRRHPEWLSLPPEQLHERLAAHAGLAPEQVRAALNDPAGQALAFTHHIQHLDALRKSL